MVEGMGPLSDDVVHGIGTTIGHDGLEGTSVLRNVALEMTPVDDSPPLRLRVKEFLRWRLRRL
jgi:hypothetical protein